MRSSKFLRLSFLLILAATSFVFMTLSGCSAGWGIAKPAVPAIAGKAVSAGQTETLNATASGTGPFTYQWYRNAVLVAGAVSNPYSFVAAEADNGASYTVAVTNPGGVAMSTPYVLAVGVAPSITTQPASRTVAMGQTATFNVVASGSGTLSYQWYKNSSPISGATASAYTSAATTVADSGSVYTVVVTNAIGTVTSSQALLTVSTAGPPLTVATIPPQAYGNGSITLSASSAGSGAITYTVVSGPATISGNTVTLTGAGTVVILVSQAGSNGYAASTSTITFTVAPGTPKLALASIGNQAYGATVTAAATSNSDGAITYSVSPSTIASIAGNTITTTGLGVVTVTASQAATANFTAATTSTTFTVGQATPTLTFAPVGAHAYGDPAFAVSASSPSSGAITYAVTSGPATISGNTVTITGPGTVVLSASQAATTDYTAQTVTTTFTVGLATPRLVLAPIANQNYGATVTASATSNSDGAITYSVSPSTVATISGSTITTTGVGTVTVTASQAATANYAATTTSTTFNVGQATPTLTFATVPAHNFGDPSFTVSASSASTGAVTYAVTSGPATVSGNTVTLTGSGTVVLSASQAATADYAAQTATTTFTVGQGTPKLVLASISNQSYGATVTASATSNSNGAITYTVSPGTLATIAGSTITTTGVGTVTVTASQAATADYTAATTSTSFSVGLATPTLTFTAIPSHTYGDAAFAVNASSASTGAVTYTVTSGPATVSGSTVTLTGAGTVVLAASQAASGSYGIATATTTFNVAQATPKLVLPSLGNQSYGVAVSFSASSNSDGAITYAVTSGPATISGSTLTTTGVGTVTVTATQAATSSYAAATASTTFTVVRATPALTFAGIAAHSFGDAPFTVNASSASPGTVTYSVVSGPATIAGNTVTLTGAGTVVLAASQAETTNYTAANTSTNLTVGQATPKLVLAPIANQIYGASVTASATSNSTGAITYSVSPSTLATVSGSTVTTTGVGTVTVTASQAATADYGATTTSTNFNVGQATPTLSFAAIPSHTFGDAAFTVSASSASTGDVTYTVASGPATVVGNTVTLTGAGTVVLMASQAASANYVAQTATATFTVGQGTPKLVLASIKPQSYGATVTASATSNSSGAITYSITSGPATIAGTTITTTGVGTVEVTASQAATADYTAATTSTTFTVNQATPTLTFAAIPAHTYGDAPFAVTASSASTGTVTYTVTSGPATISGNTVTLTGAGTVVLAASQAATTNYAAASTSTNITVGQATPTLAFTAVPSHIYGDAAFTVSASSASAGAVTYTVTSGPATVSGNTVTLTGAGTVVLAASQAATVNYAAATASTTFAVGQATPTLSFTTIPSHTYGDAAFTINASSASTGAVTYTVTSGPATISGNTVTLTGAGTVVIAASQAASTNYAATTASTSFTVAQATPKLVLATIGTQTYGATVTASATSNSDGAITYSVSPSTVATISGTNISTTGVGTAIVTASQAATANYAAATTTTTFTVNQAAPKLAFATIPSHTYGDAPFAVNASSASTGSVTYSVTSGPATISGNTVTLTGAGTVTLSASQAASANYTSANATASFTVSQGTPTLTFSAIAAHTYGDSPFAVTASSASTGAVTYSVTSGPASISGSTVTINGAGTVVLAASQAATTNYAAATTSVSFTVAPNVKISAISPAGQTIAPQQVTFTATTTGGSTNTLTWSASGGTFSGNVWTAPNTAGTYTITATSVDQPTVSVSTTMTVSKPVITTQPVSKNACAGYSPSLGITAQYAKSYQWYYNGNTLANTSNTITFTNALTSNSGTYTCAAINDAGYVTSNAVTLNVVKPTVLLISSQPASVSVYASQTATFAVGATGTGNLQYQWYKGSVGSGVAIAGATSRTYTTGALTASDSGSKFYATVTDPDCTNTTLISAAGTLTVSTADTAVPPSIVVQPIGQTATVGGTATFSVTASGSGTLSYQWYRVAYTSTQLTKPTAGVLVSGATSSTYTVPASLTYQSNDGDTYYVVVTNNYGAATSNHVGLSVGAGISLQIDDQPQTQYISANTLATFSVKATCTACTPAYQWYWYAPKATSATALANGTVSSGTLSGATITGATTSSVTLQNVPTTATGGMLYVVVTSTSDGTSQISGTNALTSTTAGLFVGSLGTVGNTTAGSGLCNSSTFNWALNGSSPGTTAGSVPYQNTSACQIEMTNGGYSQSAAVYWPTLISTANFSVAFTVQISSSGTPADGFSMVLADPSQGATTSTIGGLGEGIGAYGIPGFVLAFDTYQNGNANGAAGCIWSNGIPCDPVAVPYMAVGQGAAALWENPWSFVNGALDTQNSTNYSPSVFANATHNYVVSVVNRVMTVTMDGYELFTGSVSLPPAAYLGFTASTGGSTETVTFSKLTATVSAP